MKDEKKRILSSILATDFRVKCLEYKHLNQLNEDDFIEIIVKALQLAFSNKALALAISKKMENQV